MPSEASAIGMDRKLAAIMFTDIVGFSRQMGSDEARMLRLLEVHNQVVHHAVSGHHGHFIKSIGDAFLVDFPSVVHAVQCAQQIQSQLRTHNAEQEKAEQIHVRIGIHLGDVVQRDGDVFGDGVNIASRLQSLAEPDTICISDMVYRDVAKKVDLGTVVPLGKPKLKNITFGVRTTEAIELLEKAIRLNPRYPFTYALHLGWACNLTGRYDEAIAALKQALLRNPNWLFSHLHLFFSYRIQWSSQLSQDSQTLDRAFEAAQRMIALEAASPWSHVILSQAYLWKKQYEQVSVETEQVLNLNPTNGVIYAALANTRTHLTRGEAGASVDARLRTPSGAQ